MYGVTLCIEGQVLSRSKHMQLMSTYPELLTQCYTEASLIREPVPPPFIDPLKLAVGLGHFCQALQAPKDKLQWYL